MELSLIAALKENNGGKEKMTSKLRIVLSDMTRFKVELVFYSFLFFTWEKQSFGKTLILLIDGL